MHSVNLPQKNSSLSVAGFILSNDPKAINISKKNEDAGLVNRLDFETSGIILAAKNSKTWNKLHGMFSEAKIEKFYYALLEGKIDNVNQIENYIGTTGRNSKKVKVFSKKPASKYRPLKAISRFKLIKYSKTKNISLCSIQIVTGRRHQIRAHAAYLKHALIGDKLYGSNQIIADYLGAEFPSSFYLQAYLYRFIHPDTKEEIIISSKLPAKIEKMIS